MQLSFHRAFSLIEMLVAIAIVVILVGFLIPALSRARLSAASTACASQLRQLATAYLGYVADNDGYLPPVSYLADNPLSEGHSGFGVDLLRHYYMPGPYYAWDSNHKYIPTPLDMCPAARINKMTLSRTKGGPDYGWSAYMNDKKALAYTSPAQTPIVYDSWSGNWITGRTMPARHFGGINSAFLDGHVEYIPQTDGRLYSGWWFGAANGPVPKPTSLGLGTPLGSATSP